MLQVVADANHELLNVEGFDCGVFVCMNAYALAMGRDPCDLDREWIETEGRKFIAGSLLKGKILFDTNYTSAPETKDEDISWKEFHLDAEEELPPCVLMPRGKNMRITVCMDADHAMIL